MKIPPKCETTSRDANIVVSDKGGKNNRSKFRLHNAQKAAIRIVEVDNCAITEGIRCDYLLVLPNGQELYVELKGSNVGHAVDQIARSIELLACSTSIARLCFVSSTRCPINSAQIQTLKKKFRKKYNAKLTIKNGEITHRYLP